MRRILLVQLYHLGDVLLTTPALRAARRAFPDARIDVLTGGLGAEALEGNPHADEVLRWSRGVRTQLRLARELRRRGYDAVVDFHSRPSTALLVWRTGAKLRVGITGRGPRNLAYTRLAPREPGAVYMARQKLRLLAPLGVDPAAVEDLSLEIAVGEAEREWAGAEMRRLGLEGAPVAAVSAVSRVRFKQWGAGRWAATCDRLARAGYRVLLTHGPGEAEQAWAVAERMTERAVWDHRPTTVRQLAALYARCAVWLGNDGGPKHIAAAAGTPTVSVVRRGLGPVWSDAGDPARQRFFDPAPPQGCDRRCARCEHLGCLAAVEPAAVAEGAIEIARAEPARSGR